MKREMTMVVVAVASAVVVLARCASGGVVSVGHGVVSDDVLEMLFCRPITDCGAMKNTTSSSTSARTGSHSAGTFGGKEAT
jgi:hypothetical protein